MAETKAVRRLAAPRMPPGHGTGQKSHGLAGGDKAVKELAALVCRPATDRTKSRTMRKSSRPLQNPLATCLTTWRCVRREISGIRKWDGQRPA